MRRLLAMFAVGVFGFAAYAIAFRAIPPGSLAATVDEVSSTLGHGLTSALTLSVGIVIAWLISRSSKNAR